MRFLTLSATLLLNLLIMSLVILYIPANIVAALIGTLRRNRQ